MALKRELLPRVRVEVNYPSVEQNKHLDVLRPFSNAVLPRFMKGNRQQSALCPSDRSASFACFSFQMVRLNFERPERQAEGERYKSFNNLFKRPEKRQPRGTNSVSPRTRTSLTPA